MPDPCIRRLPRTEPIENFVEEILENGAVIATDFLPTDVLARFNSEIEPFLADQSTHRAFVNEAVAGFFGDKTRHLTALAVKSDTFVNEILCHPLYVGMGNNLLGSSCAAIQLNLGHVIDRGPGGHAQPLHRDEEIWPRTGPQSPHRMFASILALGEFTPEIGSTLIVPGSHKWEHDRKARPDEIVATNMAPGSALMYLGSTLHAGGANQTADRWRRAMHVSYCLGWLRTEENHYLSIPLDRARSLPRQAQELLGYAAHDAIAQGGGYLGTVDLQSPVDLFAANQL